MCSSLHSTNRFSLSFHLFTNRWMMTLSPGVITTVNAANMKKNLDDKPSRTNTRQAGERISGLDLLEGGHMPAGYHKSKFGEMDLAGACERIRKAAEEAAMEAGLIPRKQEYLGMFGELSKMPPRPQAVAKLGYEAGELCNRRGCEGSLMYTAIHGHRGIERQRTFCPACGWDSIDLK